LQSTIGEVLDGEGFIGLQCYGPHRQEARARLIRAAKNRARPGAAAR
jgi:hypothetical protein